jgi:AmmeMemoRadiSam system protein A/AmmeMemoRadiSam system protein B
MGNIIGYYLMPHPPIVIPEVAHGDEKKIQSTSEACKKVGLEIKESKPDTIVIISPHGVMFSDAIAISNEPEIEGSLAQFRAGNVNLAKKIDLELTDEIMKLAKEDDISVTYVNSGLLSKYRRSFELDHGAIVPLYFVEQAYSDYQLVHITYGPLKDLDLFRFGMKVREAVEHLNRKVVMIASGDLSHRLTEDGPYPFSPKGKEFDESLTSLLQKGDTLGVFKMDRYVIEEAGECGLRSIYILLGAINNDFTGKLLSYEGPFGVGYGVMKFTPSQGQKDILKLLAQSEESERTNKFDKSDDYVKLARESIKYYLKHYKAMDVPENISKELLTTKAGVFVSLHKFGNLRGCIGTFLPTQDNIADEIISNAIEAATQDPRFAPLQASEINDLDISVDVLTAPLKATRDELDPKKYGVIVTSGYQRGLLLPDLDGVDTVEEQLNIACQKAGISPKSPFDIQKFTVIRHVEGDQVDRA